MRIVSTTGATEVTHHGETFTASDGGIFEVPEHVGEELTAFPIWVPEHVALANERAAQDEHDRDPARTGERVRMLEARIADLEGRLAALEGDDDEGADPDAEPAPRQRRTRRTNAAPAETPTA